MLESNCDPMQTQLAEVCAAFRIPGQVVRYQQITAGNINKTYEVTCRSQVDGKEKLICYTVQKINGYVFKHPDAVMKNIELVTAHILACNGGMEAVDRRHRLHFHHTEDRKNYYIASNGENGDFWRLRNFVDRAIAVDSSSDPKVLYTAGKAFGHFQAQLANFDASLLDETIPHFHDTRLRLETLEADAKQDLVGRCAQVRPELEAIAAMREQACRINQLLDSGALRFRVTHNDTKTNNVLLDEETLEPLVVIDLDTVMPGLTAFDFGDAVRFAANTAVEDEPDTSKVSLNLELYRAFAEGFIGETACFLTEAEVDSMALGAFTVTVELAARFLDDYITGDKYFRIAYPEHNLVRTRCQIALAQDMQRKFAQMEQIVKEIAAKHQQLS